MSNNTQNSIVEVSAGGVVYQKKGKDYLFLLGKSSGYHKWVLPKGRIEADESDQSAALREIAEETSIVGQIIDPTPIYEEKYIYYADFKTRKDIQKKLSEQARRVKIYQESGGANTKVFKTVKYFLIEYIAGNPHNHGWEMEDCNWFSLDQCLNLIEFDGQKKAIKKAYQILNSQ